MPSKRDKTRFKQKQWKGEVEMEEATKPNRILTAKEAEELEEEKERRALEERQNKMIAVENSSMSELKELIQTLKRAAIRVEQGTGKKLKWDALVGVKKNLMPFAIYRGLKHWRSQNEKVHEHYALLEPGRRAIRLHDLKWGYVKFRKLRAQRGRKLEAMFRLYRRAVGPTARIELEWWRHMSKLLIFCRNAMQKALQSLDWSGVLFRRPFR